MGRTMGARARIGLLAPLLFTFAAVAGCGTAEAHPQPAAVTAPTPTRWPAAVAGGACYLLEYEIIEQVVGTSFDVAAASDTDETFTCVVQTKGESFPDLTLAVTATDADAAVFKSTMQPKGAAPVAGLGKIGYTLTTPAGGGAGPGIEVGWLSGNGRIMVLRYRFPATTGAADAGALAPKMVALAKKVDQSNS
jgi:hypothetical protein